MPNLNFSLLIDTRWCLDELLRDGHIDQRDYNLVLTSQRPQLHPLQIIAGFNLTDKKTANQTVANPLTAVSYTHLTLPTICSV